ncbi:MAG UNVERIFIED_CONTAM: hypothetical protein LVR18_51585 [Planctomycetaceae bacterium]
MCRYTQITSATHRRTTKHRGLTTIRLSAGSVRAIDDADNPSGIRDGHRQYQIYDDRLTEQCGHRPPVHSALARIHG